MWKREKEFGAPVDKERMKWSVLSPYFSSRRAVADSQVCLAIDAYGPDHARELSRALDGCSGGMGGLEGDLRKSYL